MEKCYIQLYSLKDEIAKDFDTVLRRVADLGYTGVEFYGGVFGGHSAADLKKLLQELNLEPLGAHLHSAQVPGLLDYACELGLKYIIDPMQGMSTDEEALAFSQVLNRTGELCAARGIKFGYHNHAHEFAPGKDGTLMDTIIKNTDPTQVCIQLDVGWVANAGVDAPAFIAKYPGRFALIHMKEDGPVATGKGIIDWEKVKDAALAQGTRAFIIEREQLYADDIYQCVTEDLAFLKAL